MSVVHVSVLVCRHAFSARLAAVCGNTPEAGTCDRLCPLSMLATPEERAGPERPLYLRAVLGYGYCFDEALDK